MGVGISSAIVYSFPFPAEWLKVVGIVIWGINMGLFLVFNIMTVLRFVLYPDQFSKMLAHPGQSAFIGCYPMGLATIINMTALIFGTRAWRAVYVMWWIDVFFTLLSAWAVVFIMFSKHDRNMDSLNATILLPVVALVVASATGGLITPNLPVSLRESTIIVSALMWGNGELLGFSCIVIYINRLLHNNLPAPVMTISSFLPVGPLGQGAFGIQNIADGLCGILQDRGFSLETTDAIRFGGVSIAVVLTGYASFWMFIAFTALVVKRPPSFNMSWWGLTFPIGTYVLSWYKLADETGVYAFKVLGALFGVLVVLMVIICVIGSVKSALFDEELFRHAQAETSPNDDSRTDALRWRRKTSSIKREGSQETAVAV
jgi:tellurite resistance protein TehA-like permease